MTRAVTLGLLVGIGVLIVGSTRAPMTERDADFVLTRQIAERVHDGQAYYPAYVEALSEVVTPPSQVRSVRLPIVGLVQSFAPGAWVLLGAALAGLSAGIAAKGWGPVGAVAIAAYMIPASPEWLVYHELFALPLGLAGLLAARRGDDLAAAGWLGLATVTREHFVLALVAAVLIRRAWPYLVAGSIAAMVYLAHTVAVTPLLSPDGYEMGYHVHFWPPQAYAYALAPGVGVAAIVLVGVVAAGLWRLWRSGAEPVTLGFVALLGPLTMWSHRPYWYLMWAPLLFMHGLSLAGDTLSGLRARALDRSGERGLPQRAQALPGDRVGVGVGSSGK